MRDKRGKLIGNFDEIVNAAEISTNMCGNQSDHASFISSSDQQNTEVPCVPSDQVRSVLDHMSLEKAASKDG